MNDIKGLQRNYPEDAVESDEVLRPPRPPRKGSLSGRPTGMFDAPTLEINGQMQRSTSELDMNQYSEGEMDKDDKKKRGRSPFRLFGKKRDQSKDKLKTKHEMDDKRLLQGRNVIQSNVMTRSPTVRVSNVGCNCQYIFPLYLCLLILG